ncbi:uncharacterized protein LOC111893479 [Lactuca sativa]|uniref:uncharacterized protein LOC111893479 n=1 Tax=Lactuca sativa TaxID=4236 RepID=UPI000CD893D6|nr:uncharacterized protein LOC111893479 [Lactuca sativa]
MGSGLFEYLHILEQLKSYSNVPKTLIYSLQSYAVFIYRSEQQNKFSEPMPWIGIYITLASLFCILSMVADLLYGFRNRKFWFPCKYFTLNAASLTVIAVAIKLPMDLTNLMTDRASKLGSLSFMCTMMANLLPSLATMSSKELVSNTIALAVLVITLVVNVCIQINTGVISYYEDDGLFFYNTDDAGISQYSMYTAGNGFIATLYVGMLLVLLIIYACSSLAILKSKQILESKYQVAHQKALKINDDFQQPGRLTIEKLKQHVSNYWIMAGTGNPQFMIVSSATTSASGAICALSAAFHTVIMFFSIPAPRSTSKSDYKWSLSVILITQFIGIILGTIAPLSRCFAALSFKVSLKWIVNHIKVSNVESYWTQKLYDWKQSSIPFPYSSRKCKIVIQSLKNLFLSICIGFQKTVVVICKMIRVIPIFFVICVVYSLRCWKLLKDIFSASSVNSVQNTEQPEEDNDLSGYVLQLQDDMEFAERTLKQISKSVNRLIQNAEKQQPKNLMKLLTESRGFEGVEKFDSHHVPSLLSEEYLHCWSLPLVTLTTIAMSLPNIQKNIVDCLLSGVSEGLVYVTLVEETLNITDDHASIQKAARTLWVEVEVYHKWLGNKLLKPTPKANTAEKILQWLRDTGKNIVCDMERTDHTGVPNGNSKCKSISANSMYRISETILCSYHENISQVSQEELFAELLSMIADILAACLTNLPQVIAMKCHTSAIEKREASVHAAAQLLGETMQIINTLQDRELPSLNPNGMAFIDKWQQASQAVAAFDEQLLMVEVIVEHEANMSEWRKKTRRSTDVVENESEGIDEDTDTDITWSNKSPVTPSGTKENAEDIGQHREGKEIVHDYVTPIGENNEAWGNINEFSSSLLFKLPRVVDEVLDMTDKVSSEKKVTYVGDNNYGVDKSLKDTINEETGFNAQSLRNLLTDLNESVVVKDKRKFER